MPVPAPERSSAAGPVLLALLALGGCGNRGELYLESPLDIEEELRAIDRAGPVDGNLDGVPGEGIAPTDAPRLGPETEPEAGPDENDEDGGDEDENDGDVNGARDSGPEGGGS